MRYAIQIQYKGTAYHGWQKQQNAHSVQSEIENAIKAITKLDVGITGGGRTDTGVHALDQWAHFDLEIPIKSPEIWLYQLNSVLPGDIRICHLYQTHERFHARHDAQNRTYLYKISRAKDPFTQEIEAHIYIRKIDIEMMQAATNILKEYQDFASFCKIHHQNEHTLCTISEAFWTTQGIKWYFEISSNRFLRGMVRLLVGTILEVGKGKLSLDDFRSIIESKDVKKAKYAAPAEGLFLKKIDYPEEMLHLLV